MANLFWLRTAPGYGDFGNELSAKICEYLTGRPFQYSELPSADLVALGTVLEPEFADPYSWDQYTGFVWGAGRAGDQGVVNLLRSQVWALRGHLTLRGVLCEHPGSVALGDPGLLADSLVRTRRKRFVLGVIPDWRQTGHPVLKSPVFRQAGVRIIDPCDTLLNVLELIGACEHILSSTLYGLIVADALRIPNAWIRLKSTEVVQPNDSDFPFRDYYSVFGHQALGVLDLTGNERLDQLLEVLKSYTRPGLDQIQRRLLESFPGPLKSPRRAVSASDGRPRSVSTTSIEAFLSTRRWQTLVLGIGTGRCGLASLVQILNRQPETNVAYYEPPNLPWDSSSSSIPLNQRVELLLERENSRIVGDAASYYLPYVKDLIGLIPELKVVCLRRPKEETVVSFGRWLDRYGPLRYNHWSRQPARGWHQDPVWTFVYPQYEVADRAEGLRRYWDDYYSQAEELARQFPNNVRIFDVGSTLNTDSGLGELLTFVGVPPEKQIRDVRVFENRVDDAPRPPLRAPVPSPNPNDPRRCVVLVPYGSPILPHCEESLRELERRGYVVQRVGGYAAIDQGRNAMASGSLLAGFEETMWIDSDLAFDPDAVDQLRAHQLPIVCGIYSQKGKRAIACHIMPGTPKVEFGRDGGLMELLYGATGFLHVRREVYLAIQDRLKLPICNQRFTRELPMIPWFQPMIVQMDSGYWYLAEDYSFCQRARDCGYKIMADTSIRLWHIGTYRYGWEDAGRENDRFDCFTLNFGGMSPTPKDKTT